VTLSNFEEPVDTSEVTETGGLGFSLPKSLKVGLLRLVLKVLFDEGKAW